MTSAPRSAGRIILCVVLALVALLIAALATQALWLGPLASSELSRRSGRAARVDTMWIGLSSSLAPVVHCRGVRIDNAPWADAAHPLVALGEATAVFSWTSIAQRRPVIALWVLADGDVDLERRADGLRNWRLLNPDVSRAGAMEGACRAGRACDRALPARRHRPRPARHGQRQRSRVVGERCVVAPDAHRAAGSLASASLCRERGQRPGAHLPRDRSDLSRERSSRGRRGAAGARRNRRRHRPSADRRCARVARRALAHAVLGLRRHASSRGEGDWCRGRAEGRRTGAMRCRAPRRASARPTWPATPSWTRSDGASVVRAKLDSDSTDVDDLRWLAGMAPAPRGRGRRSAAGRAGKPPASVRGRAASRGSSTRELSFTARRLHAPKCRHCRAAASRPRSPAAA